MKFTMYARIAWSKAVAASVSGSGGSASRPIPVPLDPGKRGFSAPEAGERLDPASAETRAGDRH
jgi:hypothetical protein